MKPDIFISIIIASIGLFSAFFLCKGVIRSTPRIIAKQAISYYGYNKYILNNLSHQKSDYYTGFFLLFISFIFQILNLTIFPIVLSSIIYCKLIVILLITCIIAILLVSFIVNILLFKLFLINTYKSLVLENLYFLFKDMGNNYYSENHFFENLKYGLDLFNFKQNDNESNYIFLRRYCDYFKYHMPDNLDVDKINNFINR